METIKTIVESESKQFKKLNYSISYNFFKNRESLTMDTDNVQSTSFGSLSLHCPNLRME